jgi:hypothetical protein
MTAVEPQPYYVEIADRRVMVIPRDLFASTYFNYKPGEHVVFGGPTQRGKTTLAFKLLEYTATPEFPAFVAVSKPSDRTTEKEGVRLEYRRVSEWPPPPKFKEAVLRERPAGYLVWPKFGDMDKDVVNAAKVTRALLMDRYSAGAKGRKKSQGILVMDDTMVKAKVLGLDREMTTVLAMAGAMGLGQWTFVQKPTDSGRTPLWSYSQSEHLFLTKDPDRRSRQRYDEIGGFDPRLVSGITETLDPFQFVYLKRSGEYICIVDKD